MKSELLPIALLLISTSAFAQQHMRAIPPVYQPDYTGSDKKPFDPKDPQREIDGKVYSLTWRDTNFVKFGGTVVKVTPEGIIMRGGVDGHSGNEFLLANFPYQVADRQVLPTFDNQTKTYLCAKFVGTYTYDTGSTARTFWKLDYGHIYTPPPPPPPTPEQIAAAKKAEEERVKKGNAATLKWLQSQAEQGDTTAARRLGEKYLKGDGVEKDLAKARELLRKASEQGDKQAAELLAQIPN